jgi:hypothetical protein
MKRVEMVRRFVENVAIDALSLIQLSCSMRLRRTLQRIRKRCEIRCRCHDGKKDSRNNWQRMRARL